MYLNIPLIKGCCLNPPIHLCPLCKGENNFSNKIIQLIISVLALGIMILSFCSLNFQLLLLNIYCLLYSLYRCREPINMIVTNNSLNAFFYFFLLRTVVFHFQLICNSHDFNISYVYVWGELILLQFWISFTIFKAEHQELYFLHTYVRSACFDVKIQTWYPKGHWGCSFFYLCQL